MTVPTGSGNQEIRVTRLSVGPPNSPIFDERSFNVEIRDEAVGEYLAVTQSRDHADEGGIG